MQFTVSLEIDRPLQEVVQLLVDPAQRPMWLRGLVLHEPVSGEDGQVGTVSRVVLQTGKQTMEATETITRREPADLDVVPPGTVVRFEREIVADGMWNGAAERLSEAGPRTTLWESTNEFRFSSVPMRVVGLLMGRTFRTQSLRHMHDVKAFAEHGTDVRDTSR